MDSKKMPVIDNREMLKIWNDPSFNLQQCTGDPLNKAKHDDHDFCGCKQDDNGGLCSQTSQPLCKNRSAQVECEPFEANGSRHTCLNQEMQKMGKNVYEESMICEWHEQKGIIVKCTLDIEPNVFVIQYTGKLMSYDDYNNLRMTKYKEKFHYYGLEIKTGVIIDSTECGNHSRFFSHSCNGNLECNKWISNGRIKMGLFSKRFIPALEELTYQYKLSGNLEFECFCGDAKCQSAAKRKIRTRTEPLFISTSSMATNPAAPTKYDLPVSSNSNAVQNQATPCSNAVKGIPSTSLQSSPMDIDDQRNRRAIQIQSMEEKVKVLETEMLRMKVKCESLEASNMLYQSKLCDKTQDCDRMAMNHQRQIDEMNKEMDKLKLSKCDWKGKCLKERNEHKSEILKLKEEINRLNKLLNNVGEASKKQSNSDEK